MTDHNELLRHVLEDVQHDDDERKPGKPDPTADLDDFARRAFGNH